MIDSGVGRGLGGERRGIGGKGMGRNVGRRGLWNGGRHAGCFNNEGK